MAYRTCTITDHITEKQYVQASVFIAAFDLQMLVMETSALTPDQQEATYDALDALVEAVK